MGGQEVRSQEAKVGYGQPHEMTVVQGDDLGWTRRAQGSRWSSEHEEVREAAGTG